MRGGRSVSVAELVLFIYANQKALDLSPNLFGSVGSNPTGCTHERRRRDTDGLENLKVAVRLPIGLSADWTCARCGRVVKAVDLKLLPQGRRIDSLTKSAARRTPVIIAHADDVAEWSKLL